MARLGRILVVVMAVAAVVSGLGHGRISPAAVLTWDSDLVTPGIQDGAGTWDTSTSSWWTGSAYQAWANASNNTAAFGGNGAAGTVTLGTGITVGGLVFNSGGTGNYEITGSTLTFAGGTATTGIAANVPATISSNIAVSATPLWFSLGKVTLSGATLNGSGQNFVVGLPGNNTNAFQTLVAVRLSSSGGSNQFGELMVGRGDNTAGALYVDSGTTTFGGGGVSGIGVGSGAAINAEASGTGTNNYGFMEVGGSATVNCIEWNIGNRSKGVMYVTGGTVNNTSWNTRVGGRNTGGVGVLDLSGGAWNQNNPSNGGNAVEIAANSCLNVRGGTLNVMVNKNILINSSSAVLNVGNAGVIQTVPYISGTGALNFNNGTLQARASESNFLRNTGGIYIYSGGATIDTQANSVGISGNLLAPPGNGVNGSDFSSALTGLVGAPMVTFSGGGSGATAVADFNSATGQVTGITITNPGISYTSAPTITLTGGGLASPVTYNGTFAANTSGGLTKIGTGTLTLSGTNTYTGETRAKAGTLIAGGGQLAATSSLALENATFVASSSIPSSGSLTNLTLGALATDTMTLKLMAADAGGTNKTISTTNLIGNANGTAYLNVSKGGTWTVGNTYSLITYGSAGGTYGIGSLALSPASATFGTLDTSVAGVIGFKVTGLPDGGPFTYTGAIDGNWDFGTPNFKGGTSAAALFSNTAPNAVTFDDTATGPAAIVLNDTVTPSTVTFNNNSLNYSVSGGGKISTTAQLIKSGTGTLTLSTVNDYTGGTQLNGGTLRLGSATALPNAGAVAFGGGSLDLNGLSATVGSIEGTAGSIINSSATAGTLTINQTTGTKAYSGTLNRGSNTLNLTKSGAGTLVVSSAGNTLSALTLSAGQLTIDNSVAASPAMTLSAAPTIELNGGLSTLDINNATFTTPGLTIRDGRIVVEGTSSFVTIGGDFTMGTGDSRRSAVYLKNSAVMNGTGRMLNLGPGFTQQAIYFRMQDSSQATFSTVSVLNDANYTDGHGHGTVLEISDSAQLTASSTMYVVRNVNDQNRAGTDYAYGQVYQHGGTVTVNGSLRMGDNDTAVGTGSATHKVVAAYNLGAGGTLNVAGRVVGGMTRTGYGQSFFNFHGGTLKYTGAAAQTDWINLTVTAGTGGTTSANNLRVWEGGTIDTGSQNLTVSQALMAPTGNGIGAIATTGLTTQVYGNSIPPWVYIDGGGGSGATAVATLNASGNIDQIIITNPGNGYTSVPTVRIVRANETQQNVPAGNITLADNSTYTGGLTKKGSGTLLLNAVNTYRGDTVVEEGVLQLGLANAIGSNGGGLVVKTGGTANLGGFTTTFTGTVSFQGGSITNGTLVNNTAAYEAQSGSASIDLTGSAGLNKTTSGVFSLVGNKSYTGPTAVTAGELQVGGTLASSGVTVANGAKLSAAGSNVTVNALTLGSAGTDTQTLSAAVGSAIFTVSNSNGLTANGTTSIQVGGTLVQGQQYVLIDYAGALQGSGTFTPVFTGRTTGNIVNNLANTSIDVNITGSDSPRWTGATDAKWDTTTTNWRLIANGTPTTFINSTDSVLFNDLATGPTSIDIVGTVRPTAVIVNNSTLTYAFATTGAGKISDAAGGPTSLLKQGTGTLQINNPGNDYTGGTTIAAGTLLLGNNNVLPATGAILVNGGTLDLGGWTQTVNGAVTLQSGTIGGTGTLSKTGGAFVVESGTVSATLSGTAGLTKNTAGTVTLNIFNDYSGTTTLNEGVLEFASGALSANSALSFAGGTLRWGAFNFDSLGAVSVGIGQVAKLDPNGNFATAGGVISGAGGLTLNDSTGLGALTLGAANTFSGDTRIVAGTLYLGHVDALKNSTLNLDAADTGTLGATSISAATLGGLKGAGPLAIPGSFNLSVGNNNQPNTYSGTITGGAGSKLTKVGTGTQTLTGTGSTVGQVNVYGGGTLVVGSGAEIVSTSASDIIQGSTLRISSGAFTNGGADEAHDGQRAAVVVEGTGILTANGEWLMGRNMGSGSLVVKDDGVLNGGGNALRMGRDNIRDNYVGLKNNAQATFGSVVVFDTSYYGEGGAGSGSVLEVANNATLTTGSMTIANFLGNNATVHPRYGNGQVYQSGGTVTVNGNIAMGLSVPQAGDVLTGTYNLNGGELKTRQINNGNAAIPGTANVNLHGGKLTYNNTVSQSDFIKLGPNGKLYLYEASTIDTNGQDVTINQPILSPNTGSGLSAVAVPTPIGAVGAYVVPPEVYVSGDGAGATAVANLNSSGQVASITVTNPGVGYTTKPTVQLYYGGAPTSIDSANVNVATNAYAGGLTKKGIGTLTLTSPLSYTGATVLDAGTLDLEGATNALGTISGAGSLTVGATATAALTANSIVADTLTIGAGSSVTIRAVPVAGEAGASAVPEPGTWLLLAAGAACLLPLWRRRMASKS